MSVGDERRSFQRLSLTRPVDGWFGDFAIRLVDVSAAGALIESQEEIPDDALALLRFYWRGTEVEVMSQIVRHADGRAGLRFTEDCQTLRGLIAMSAAEQLAAQMANAAGNRESNKIGDATLTAFSAGAAASSSGYIVFTWDGASWSRRASLLSDQPADGFTVAASLLPHQVEMLCRTYESGNEEARRLTRLLAELSVTKNR